jgi:Mrp family chromosome partitioning ATPase
MTNETRLAQASGLTVAALDPVAATAPPGATVRPVGFKKMHRLLRGRYPTVITLGIIFGLLGLAMGYFMPKPTFQSFGRIEINPAIPSVTSAVGELQPGYSSFIQSQVTAIETHEMAVRAMNQQEWKNAEGASSADDEAVERFVSYLDAEQLPGTNIIKIAFSDPDPKLARAGALAMCLAYQAYFKVSDPLHFNEHVKMLEDRKNAITTDLHDLQVRLDQLANIYGTSNLTDYLDEEMKELALLGTDLNNAKMDYSESLMLLGGAQGGPAAGTKTTADNKSSAAQLLTPEQIAEVDPTMRQMLARRSQDAHMIAMLKADNYMPNHPRIHTLQNEYDVDNAEIQSYIDQINHAYATGNTGSLPAGANLQASLRAKAVRVDLLTKQVDTQTQYCKKVGEQAGVINETRKQIDERQQELDSVTTLFNQLTAQQTLMGDQMEIISYPGQATEPLIDRRTQLAVLGFLGGGLAPAFLMMLFGLVDGRYRYSDETNTDLAGVPMLGILPNLPDLLTDPAQAATAAHCVHQIRTILQITGHGIERRAFAVTSASPGDGKTSLTLALGLSFAASGSRTLLIDGDLVGGGLTARLNITAEHGVLEAMASRDILPFIRATDVNDLSFMPLGHTLGGYTGTISPAALRRLIDEARKHFEVILVDTGPILGSIEASPVAVAVDGVVLCVPRGQQRQMLDRALAHLHAIGAKLAGVVFNRAEAYDFARSTNRLIPGPPNVNGNGRHRQEPIGPVAKAVASSVRSAPGPKGGRAS